MKTAIVLVVSLLVPCWQLLATGFVTLAGEATLPVPPGWQLVGDSSDYPFQLVTDELDAEVLIFRSMIISSEAITDEQELKRSVEQVLADVIPQLPESRLQTNVGFTEGDRAGFVLEFLSTDTASGAMIQHRMKGLLYRHPNGQQLLFTIWAKAPASSYTEREHSIKLIQDGFYYTGVHEPDVFARKSRTRWYLLATVVAIVALLYFFRTYRARQDRIRFHDTENHWRCSCGRVNNVSVTRCRRCGRERAVDQVT